MATVIPENREISSFLVTKVSNWRGKYKRILSIGTHAITTYNPNSLEVTNQWAYSEVVGVKAAERFEFVLSLIRKKKRDTMKFTCDYRSELLCDLLRVKYCNEKQDCARYEAFKYHWSGTKLPVLLEVNQYGIIQLEPTTTQPLAVYPFHSLEGISTVDNNPQVVILNNMEFHRLHIFECPRRNELVSKVHENSSFHAGVNIQNLRPFPSVDQALAQRLGRYSLDEHLTSLIEFPVHKSTPRHPDAVRRLLCLTETCLLERDPDSYR